MFDYFQHEYLYNFITTMKTFLFLFIYMAMYKTYVVLFVLFELISILKLGWKLINYAFSLEAKTKGSLSFC